MFGIGNLERFNDRHRIVIADTFHALRDKYPKVFGRVADISSVELYWNSYLDVDNGVLGWFRWYNPDGIELSTVYRWKNPETGEYDASLKKMMPMLCHELHHKHQWSTNPFKYLLGLYIKPLIEDSADRITDRIKGIMN